MVDKEAPVRPVTLGELPRPPEGRVGWPWTESSPPLTHTMTGGTPWPRISIVTPSYNQGQYIEETIRSVLLQGYPDLEYIIIDGGSTDNTMEIIRKYEPWLAYWVSEPDAGQADAINKGWRTSHGDFVSWLNSDDWLEPGALCWAVQTLAADCGVDLVYGDAYVIDAASAPVTRLAGAPFDPMGIVLRRVHPMPQPGFLMRRRLLSTVGWLDENFQFVMDYDYWTRVALAGCRALYLGRTLASFRTHPEAKTTRHQDLRIKELYRVFDKVMVHPLLPKGIALQRQKWEAVLHLDAATIAYRAGDAHLARQYAVAHLRSAGSMPSLLALVYLAMSCLGDTGMSSLGRAYRAAKSALAPLWEPKRQAGS
jgi:hypothetical protein